MSGSGGNTNTTVVLAAATAAAVSALATLVLTRKNERGSDADVSMQHSKKRTSFIVDDFPHGVAETSAHSSNVEPGLEGGGVVVFPYNHEEKMRRRIASRIAVEAENVTPRNSVTVRVPGTSANMGPGYDCLGMAVDLWSEVTVERAPKFEIIASGEGAAEMPLDETNYMCVGMAAAFATAGKDVPILRYTVTNRIPYARGLGSSSAAIVAGIIAGLVLAGHKLPCWGSEALLQIAAEIEGHPDNVAPVIYGGIQLGIHNGKRWVTERIPTPPGLQMVMFIPMVIGKTSTARGVLQPEITRADAAFNIGRAAFLVNALCQGNLDNLRFGVEDKMHQPQRADKLYPFLYPMIEAAHSAGASCAYLSGAGPTVMAITSGASGDIFTQREKERTDQTVAKALLAVAKTYGVSGKVIVSQVSHEGAKVVRVDPPFSTDNILYSRDLEQQQSAKKGF
mmetsp:Transcript_38215/g.88920  ORF Transcript_38215/g.88920 Transcript_38215/m.88920 type:complete len:452 (-) Transcript_38215:123-1478(-)